jgi:hypothetical protein
MRAPSRRRCVADKNDPAPGSRLVGALHFAGFRLWGVDNCIIYNETTVNPTARRLRHAKTAKNSRFKDHSAALRPSRVWI